MRYRVTHTTSYTYAEPVPVCHNEAYLVPRNDERQKRRKFRLKIHPRPAERAERTDSFGNRLSLFSIQTPHRKLVVTATGEVDVLPAHRPVAGETPPWETLAVPAVGALPDDRFAAEPFRYDSPAIARSEELAAYARVSFLPGRPILEAANELADRIHVDFQYDPAATTVRTGVDEVLAMRRGVCQDFAHFAIGCLRSLGLAARYVSGYVRTIPPIDGVADGSAIGATAETAGAVASHAWLSVWCGGDAWIDIDPTNRIEVATDHITLAWGRDYFDVCPIKGILVGGGEQRMDVLVEVTPLD